MQGKSPESTQRALPLPYASYLAFENFLTSCARLGLPAKIREGDFPKISRPVFAQLIPSLCALGLIDGVRSPTERLRRLVVTVGRPEHAQAVGEMLDGAFAFLGPINLATATPSDLSDAFATSGRGEGTIKKARTFYLTASRKAGRTIGPRLEFGRRIRRGPSGKATRRSGVSNGEREQRLVLAQLVVAKMPELPPFDSNWGSRERSHWFRLVDRLARLAEPK